MSFPFRKESRLRVLRPVGKRGRRVFLFCKESGIHFRQVDFALLVIAKQPLPGKVKTRLCPPCTQIQAAELAEAALLDTLAAVAGTRAARRVLVFEGDPGPWQPDGFDAFVQRGDGLGERLEAAFDDIAGPALLVGMDTPQLTSDHLEAALTQLRRPGVDAVIAPTFDGGYWCVGFTAVVPGAFDGVPMSTEQTYSRQLERFDELGLSVQVAAPLRDVDTMADARLVADEAPDTHFGAVLAGFGPARFDRAA
jgi:rSAM/selenodomain-associated transferase 1